MLKRKMIVGMIVAVLVSMSTTAWGTTYYVDENGDDSNGLSWATAFNYLQDAIDEVSSSDEIWVAEGTYYPDEGDTPTNDDRTETFQLVDGAGIYGGFDGTETARSQRDWVNHITILSGDIGYENWEEDNSYHVVTGAGDANTIIDGFTITSGFADGSGYNSYGAGMFNYYVSPTVKNCSFISNDCYNYYCGGGGMCNMSCNSIITGCTFYNNKAAEERYPDPPYSGEGGAMVNYGDSAPTITNCVFFTNYSRFGGAIGNTASDPIIANCVFFLNVAKVGGGGIMNSLSAPIMTNCTFTGNLADFGGGMYNVQFIDQILTNCIFWDNEAGGSGDEIYNYAYSDLTIGYCDVEGGWSGSGVYNGPYSTITSSGGNIDADPCFINIFDFSDITVAAGTTTTIEVTDANRYTVNDEIEYDNDGVARKVTDVNTTTDIITFANDALDANSVMGKVIFDWGFGATDLDEDFHLDWDSTCINVGDPNGDYDGQTDIDGEDRVSNTVEIGADEFQECLSSDANEYDDWLYWERPDCWCYQKQCRGDINGTSFLGKPVTLSDLNTFKLAFNQPDPNVMMIPDGICADLNHDSFFGKRVTATDLNIFKEYFSLDEGDVPPCDETPIITGPYNFWTN